MAKTIQGQEEEEERVVPKSRRAVMNRSSYFTATSSSTASSPIASDCPRMPKASEQPDSKVSVYPSSFDAASTSQVRLKDAYLGGLMGKRRGNRRIKMKKKIQKTPTILRLRLGTTRGNLLPKTAKLGEQPLHTQPVVQLTWKSKGYRSDMEPQCPHTSHCLEAVFSIVRKIYGRQPGDPMKDLNVNLAIWRMFMNTTLRAEDHLGKDCDMI